MITIGALALFTNLFGVSAGWGMVVFVALTFPGLIFACGFCETLKKGHVDENNT